MTPNIEPGNLGPVFTGGFPPRQNVSPDHDIVGTCSACGGPMVRPTYWAGSPEVYPRPKCANCGKQQKVVARWGPVIEVE